LAALPFQAFPTGVGVGVGVSGSGAGKRL